jgi:phosphatidylethanolamine/phosphatidyl-N-methylethanolamine N-methyltransferase
MIDHQATSMSQARYNRIASIYDRLEFLMEFRAKIWRQKLWSRLGPGKILEVGVGTGKNMPYYPEGAEMCGIDLSDHMLARARSRANQQHVNVHLVEMDVQLLDFPDNHFDAAVATFVFCSVPDPIQGMKELARVVKPEGTILLLEHVRLDRSWIGRIMDLINPLVVRMLGANINRRTVDNARSAGLELESVEDMTANGLVQFINARPKKRAFGSV